MSSWLKRSAKTTTTSSEDERYYEPSWMVQDLPIGGETPPGEEPFAPARSTASVLVSRDEPGIQWSPGTRLHDLFDERCDSLGRRARRHVAIDYGGYSYSYADLATQANKLARYLAGRGIRPGARIALLMDRSIHSHAAVLALSKLAATYVPLDASFPADRIAYILQDSEVAGVLTLSRFVDLFDGSLVPVVALDDVHEAVTAQRGNRFAITAADAPDLEPDPVSYVIYTSGTTGRPKGVPIRHSSICNFVSVASIAYGYSSHDRVYQGMTIAFDFSVEELWVPLVAGATLVPAPTDMQLVGSDLQQFLAEHRVTALCCVPTLLATLEPDLGDLTLLLVSGEACPADMIGRWFRPGLRILNAYGPTETTVTATWSVMKPGREVTIGGPLPTYSVVILDPDQRSEGVHESRALALGDVGEICIAGVAVSDGYLNRPDQTAGAFIDDFIGMPDNPTGRIYRTGDLGRINQDCEIEYLGRIDTQVKIRGYRIELDEIEAVARQAPGVAHAVVQPLRSSRDNVDLVAYLTPEVPGTTIDSAAVDAVLRTAMPAYMIPAYYEQLERLPLLPSTKVDRSGLPPPSGPRFVASGGTHRGPSTPLEAQLADLLIETMNLDEVSVDAHFIDDLGANSLVLASFVTAIRASLDVKRVSMKRLYQNPSIAELATAFDGTVVDRSVSASDDAVATAVEASPVDLTLASARLVVDTAVSAAPFIDPSTIEMPNFERGVHLNRPEHEPGVRVADRHEALPHVASDAAHIATGVAQVTSYALVLLAASLGSLATYRWVNGASGIVSLYLRSVVAGAMVFFGGSIWLVAVKWVAVGRFSRDPIPLWSGRYLQFWIARMAIQANPMNLFVGTPIYNTYLRALGMRIGADTVILARPPVCTDLIKIGDRSVIRQDVVFRGYTAENGYLYPGSITIGSDALICEATVLEIDTVVGDRSQLGTTSALLEGQQIPSGATYQGSPAGPVDTDYDRVPSCPPAASRATRFTIIQLIGLCFGTLPTSFLSVVAVARFGFSASSLAPWGGMIGRVFSLAVIAGLFYFGGLVVSMVTVLVIPRLLNRFVVPQVAHPLYGPQYQLARAIARFTNNKILNTIFGDSSMIVHYLSVVGYDLSRSTQTGSNFGVDQRHHSPFLCTFNRETLVSDGLFLMNMEVSKSSFVLQPITMPPDTYLGNNIHYPAGARVGPNCLLATKAAIPIDGPVRSDVGLLGSPPFEIPRSVARDHMFDHYKQPGVIEQRLRAKLKSNLITAGLYILRGWALTLLTMALTLLALAAFDGSHEEGLGAAFGLAAASLLILIDSAIFSILLERLVRRFRPLEPVYCSLYDEAFWNHERFWKLNYNAFLRVFDGTPFKPIFLRMQGARLGRKVFDDGAGFTEPTLVEVGDYVMLNFGATIQCHSLEDGTFKSDRVRVGNGCTIGTNGFVHYGTVMHDGATLEADSFLMKGSSIEVGTRWRGNPAREAEITVPVARALTTTGGHNE